MDPNDLARAGYACSMHNTNIIGPATAQIYEWNVFNDAAELQVRKNKCLIEQIEAIKEDKELFDHWYQHLAKSWLAIRKADILLSKCDRSLVRELNPQDVEKNGLKVEYDKLRARMSLIERGNGPQALSDKMLELCNDPDQVNSMRISRDILLASLPAVSDAHLFSAIGKSRGVILNAAKDGALSDKEILQSSIRNMDTGQFATEGKEYDALKTNLVGILDKWLKMRKTTADKLESKRDKDGSYYLELSPDLKQAMFEDQSVYQALIDRKQIPDNYNGLQNTTRQDTTSGAYCLLSKYEPRLIPEIAQTAGEMAVAGGLVKKMKGIFKFPFEGLPDTKWANSLIRLVNAAKKVRKVATRNGALAGLPMGIQGILKTCGAIENIGGNVVGETLRTHAEINYLTGDIRIPPEKTPSCKTIENKNMLIMHVKLQECIARSIWSLTAISLGVDASDGL